MLSKLGYTALLLGVLVFVHEFGHFLVAKLCKVKVLKFSIGFGPRLIGFTIGETEYRLSWLPLGGYVKMAGDLPYDELPPEEASRGFLAQPPWKRAAIVAAGPVFNLVFPILVYFFVFLGTHETISTRIGYVVPGLPAAEAKIEPGDRILAVDGKPVETFEELRAELQPAYQREIRLTVEREGKTFVTALTPAKNIESNPVETVPRGMIGIMPWVRPPVLGVPAGSPAEAAGLRTFDRVLSVNGVATPDEPAFRHAIAQAQGTLTLQVSRTKPVELPGVPAVAPSLVTLQLPRQEGTAYAALGAEPQDLFVATVIPGSPAAQAGLKVGDRLTSLNGSPLRSFQILELAMKEAQDKPFTLGWRSGTEEKSQQLRQANMEFKDEMGQVSKVFTLGAEPFIPSAAEALTAERISRYMGPVEAFGAALKIVPDAIGKMAVVLGRLFTGDVPFSSLGGPIMIYQLASKSAEAGMDSFLSLMALISINLGLMNLLPIPVLDGFHLLSAAWEGIRRRPIPTRAREVAQWVGLAVLAVLMVLVMKNDLMR